MSTNQQIALKIPERTMAELRSAAAKRSIPVSHLINELIFAAGYGYWEPTPVGRPRGERKANGHRRQKGEERDKAAAD